jgi:hypothetical protein
VVITLPLVLQLGMQYCISVGDKSSQRFMLAGCRSLY